MSIERHILSDKAKKELHNLAELVRLMDVRFEELLASIPNPVPDHILICMLIYRKALEKADAIQVNIEHGTEHASQSILRDLLENVLSLAYILKEKTEERAKAYYVGSLRSTHTIMSLMKPNTPKAKILRSAMGDEKNSEISDAQVEEGLKQSERKLQSSWIKPINNAWNKQERDRRRPMNWYSLNNGVDSIRKMAIAVDMQAEYEVFYSVYSLETHSLNAMKLLEQIGGEGFIRPLRSYEDPFTIVSAAQTFLWKSSELLIRKMFPDKLVDFTMESFQFISSMKIDKNSNL